MVELIIATMIGVAFGWILKTVLPAIVKTIKSAIQTHKNHPKIEKNTVFLTPYPIAKSPKNYFYYLDDKKRTPHCVKCSTPPNLVPLERIGKFSKKYICPICKTKYKK